MKKISITDFVSDKKKKVQKASPEQIYFVGKNGIKVYPVFRLGYWSIEVNNNGRIFRFDKKVSHSGLNEAVSKTIIFYYNKLKE
jgi:hypothetical protein